MPTVRINGVDVEVPRHVHRAEGTSKIVWTEEECVAACCTDGWHPVPPSVAAPVVEPEPESVQTVGAPVVYQDGEFVEVVSPSEQIISEEILIVSDEPTEDDKIANQLHYVEPETDPAPVQRKRGRPRKVQP